MRGTLDRVLDALRPEANVPEEGATGLVCMFCGEDGFETQEELDEHLEAHPYLSRRREP